jgi:hypothetical protein
MQVGYLYSAKVFSPALSYCQPMQVRNDTFFYWLLQPSNFTVQYYVNM